MSSSISIYSFAIGTLLTPSFFSAWQQQHSIGDLLFGRVAVASMAPQDLPDDFKPVKLAVGGSFDLASMYDGSIAMAGGAFDAMKLYRLRQLYWTKGDETWVSGAKYLITYRLVFEQANSVPGAMSFVQQAPAPPTGARMQLELVRVDSIQSIGVDTTTSKPALLYALHVGPQGTTRPPDTNDILDAKRVAAVSQIKQIALATTLYESDNDDVLPYPQGMAALKFVTRPYLKNDAIWNDPNPNGGGFRFNYAIGGVDAASIDSPATTVMYYESLPWPDGKRVVAFVDGHGKVLDPIAWKSASATLRKRFKRKAKPLPMKYGVGKSGG